MMITIYLRCRICHTLDGDIAMTINKYFIFSPQASEEQIQPVLIEKEVQRQEALKRAQTQGGFDTGAA